MSTVLPSINMDVGLSPVVVNALEDLSLHAKMKRKDDSIGVAYAKILDQSKKRLNSLDAQRIVSVVDDTAHKCQVVTLFPFIVENIERYSVILGPELLNALKEYDRVQQLYMNALNKVRKLRPCSSRSVSQNSNSNMDAISQTSNDLEYNSGEGLPDHINIVATENVNRLAANLSNIVNTIVHLFRSNPVAAGTLKTNRNERSYEANTLIDLLLSLREELYNRLVTTASEEQEKQKMSVQILKREKKARSAIKKLETELDKGTNEKRDMIQSKNELIRSLKASIQAIEQDSDVSNRKMVNDAKKMEAAEIKNSEVTQSKLQQDIISMKQTLQGNAQKHRESELLMRKGNFKIETEVENWLQQYDTDMTEKQDGLDEISAIYAEEKNQLEQLEERFETLEIEYIRIVEERRIHQERMEEQEREMKRMIKAATLLQSFWRSYKCRKALKAKSKKGKKGKGGKKKRK